MIEIRPWIREDIPTVSALEKDCFSDPWSTADFEGAFDSAVTEGLVLMHDGQLIGYALLASVLEDADVANVAVAPSYRKKGFGKTLLKALLDRAKEKGVLRVFLEVRVSNAPAIALYKSFGFESVNVRKRYYPDGEDAFLMALAL